MQFRDCPQEDSIKVSLWQILLRVELFHLVLKHFRFDFDFFQLKISCSPNSGISNEWKSNFWKHYHASLFSIVSRVFIMKKLCFIDLKGTVTPSEVKPNKPMKLDSNLEKLNSKYLSLGQRVAVVSTHFGFRKLQRTFWRWIYFPDVSR